MIFDKINNIERYGKDFQKIKDYITNNEFCPGKSEIEGDEFFVIGLQYTTKQPEEGLWEGHRKYLDIHYIIEGSEIVQINDIDFMISAQEYQNDFELFDGSAKHQILLQEKDFLILNPNEIHKTGCLNMEEPSIVKKFVFKLLIED